jgi:hypothetical protein
MLYGRLTVNPISAVWNTVARFDDHADAQQAVPGSYALVRLPAPAGQPYSIMPRR